MYFRLELRSYLKIAYYLLIKSSRMAANFKICSSALCPFFVLDQAADSRYFIPVLIFASANNRYVHLTGRHAS